MRVEEALDQVRTIQLQLVRTRQFCCYRSATIALSGVLGLGAAGLQSRWMPHPTENLPLYLALWISVAAVSATITGLEILWRWCRSGSTHARQQTLATVRQFAPCLVAGAVVTGGVVCYGPEHAALLPALWAIIFSLGIFASSTHLPSGSIFVAVYYLLAGLVCLRWGQAPQALQPWTMIITFVVGQWLAAAALYRHQERSHEFEQAV